MYNNQVLHIIGIGGIGMSAIAEILSNLNYDVQGSDTYSNNSINRLEKFGIKVYIGHCASNLNQAQIVVYSSAIKSDNVELTEAKKNNKIILHRSEILAELTKDKYTIAISGSSGKTTTTAMIASIFDHSNIDATVIVGGILNSYQSNAKFGKSNIFLLEADESDKTMLKISSDIAVITSINNDHIDHYGTFDDIKRAFKEFVDKADYAIFPESININYAGNNITTFGFDNANIKAINVKQNNNNLEFDVLIAGCNRKYGIILPNTIGLHKVTNALAAISVAVQLGISIENIQKGLFEFKGVRRRFSTIANVSGIRLIEDYAHHPEEIQATLTAARSITQGKVIAIVELLRFARIRNFFDEFVKVFMMFDYVILTTVHPPEDPLIPGYNIKDIKSALVNSGFHNIKVINDSSVIAHFIDGFANSEDVVLFIGAGNNISRLAQETAELLIRVN